MPDLSEIVASARTALGPAPSAAPPWRRPARLREIADAADGPRPPDAMRRFRSLLGLAFLLLPTLASAIYFGPVASGRYVSHAVFLVRTAARPAADGGLGAFLRLAGLGRAEDDTFAVQDFLQSRDAVRRLQSEMPLADMYGGAGVDWLSRYPTVLTGSTNEDLYAVYRRMTSVTYNGSTGLTTLDVEAFRPGDALRIARGLLAAGEELVNAVNARIRADAVGVAEDEVDRDQRRLTEAQVAVTAFQNQETMIDPASSALLVSEIVGKLQSDLAQQQARIADMAATAPANPAFPALRRQAEVTRQQIEQEQGRVTTAREGLADKLGAYQRLVLERDFATRALALATASLDAARAEARRKQLYIARVVEPALSDEATEPRRLWRVFTVAMVNVLALFVGWVLRSGITEHRSGGR